jgi:hypothetical protein
MEAKEKELHDKIATLSEEYMSADKPRKAAILTEIEAVEDEAGHYFGEERSKVRQLWTDKQHNFIAAVSAVIKKIRLNG